MGEQYAPGTPPKPDEPLGLGAVVEDTEGRRWVMTGRTPNWLCVEAGAASWSDIPAVRVLSAGIGEAE